MQATRMATDASILAVELGHTNVRDTNASYNVNRSRLA